MSSTPIKAALIIARTDQEEATFQELYSDWIDEDGNRERLVQLFDRLSSLWPDTLTAFDGGLFNRKKLVRQLAHDGILLARLRTKCGDEWFIEDDKKDIEQFIDWLEVNDNRSRLANLESDFGDWNQLLVNAFLGSQTDEAIFHCFASYRIRQLTSKALSKIYFTEEPAE